MNTRIVMSFAMAHGGWNFSHWLWLRLKRHYNLPEPGAVYNDYLDSIDMPLPDGATMERKIDERPSSLSTDSRPIGTERTDWRKLWTDALSMAQVALVVINGDATFSEWCNLEAKLIVDEQQARRASGRPELRTVVLSLIATDIRITREVFPDARIVVATNYTDFCRERSDDRPQDFEPLLTGDQDWKITETAWQKLLEAIGRID